MTIHYFQVRRAVRHARARSVESSRALPSALRFRVAVGFTLVELLIALMVASVSMSAAVALFKRGFENQARAAEVTHAAFLARGVVARLQAMEYAEALQTLRAARDYRAFESSAGANDRGSTAAEAGRQFRWQAEIMKVSPDLELVEFHIRIGWPWPEQRHELTFPAALAKR